MPRSVRPDILAAWAAYLTRNGCATDVADALALGLEAIAVGHGVSIDRLRPVDDPRVDWRTPTEPGDAAAGIAAARQAITATRTEHATPGPENP